MGVKVRVALLKVMSTFTNINNIWRKLKMEGRFSLADLQLDFSDIVGGGGGVDSGVSWVDWTQNLYIPVSVGPSIT
jgi:hypothetical protein